VYTPDIFFCQEENLEAFQMQRFSPVPTRKFFLTLWIEKEILVALASPQFFMEYHSLWSPTGKPVVPKNHTRLRQWTLKIFGAQPPRLRRVIRPAAKSAEAR